MMCLLSFCVFCRCAWIDAPDCKVERAAADKTETKVHELQQTKTETDPAAVEITCEFDDKVRLVALFTLRFGATRPSEAATLAQKLSRSVGVRRRTCAPQRLVLPITAF